MGDNQQQGEVDAATDASSYYAILNVSKYATQDEIKRAYRQLAQVFHPDKHTNQELRDSAQEAFSKLQVRRS